MIIVIQNDLSNSHCFSYVEQPTRVFVNNDIRREASFDFWSDYYLTGQKVGKTFQEYLIDRGFIETKEFYEVCL